MQHSMHGDPAGGVMDAPQEFELDLSTPPRGGRWRGRLVALLGIGALVAAGVVALRAAGDDDPSPDDEAAIDDGDTETDLDAAGQYDGLDSVRLPLEVTPDSDLVDGQSVRVRGTGFTPGASVALIQCAGINGENGQAGEGGVGNCDLSNYVLGGVDQQGFVDMQLTVHRYIATGDGEIDCALATVQCAMAIGNIQNYDESGVAPIWFDGNVEGVRSPYLTLDRTSGLRDGDPIVVTGANFQPGEEVSLSQCIIGGPYSFGSCFASDLITDTVVVGDDGTFTVTISARRELPFYGADCFDDPYGCRVAAQGWSDAPNPVGITYDGSVLSPSYTVTPSDGLADGDVVRLAVFGMPADGVFNVRQCADGGPRGLFCADLGIIDVLGGSGVADVAVQQVLTLDGDEIECTEPGRVCYLELDGDLTDLVRGPVRFAS
ncbi:MAG: neocarzinostatin apoprotein domain-containing protein [Actinomycetota bacterium]